jgi:hypothetical protein
MYTKSRAIMIAAVIFLVGLMCGVCDVSAAGLKTIDGGTPDSSGTYTVIRYGQNYADDVAALVVIVPEKGKYAFEVNKPAFEYRVQKGLTAKQAMEMAQDFVSRHREFQRSQTSSVLGPEGNVIAFEVKALYKTTFLGMDDVIYTDYVLRGDDRVQLNIRLDDAVRRQSQGRDGRGGLRFGW